MDGADSHPLSLYLLLSIHAAAGVASYIIAFRDVVATVTIIGVVVDVAFGVVTGVAARVAVDVGVAGATGAIGVAAIGRW